jgi:hypothetical protein
MRFPAKRRKSSILMARGDATLREALFIEPFQCAQLASPSNKKFYNN